MGRLQEQKIKCHECNKEMICPTCKAENGNPLTQNFGTLLSDWMYKHNGEIDKLLSSDFGYFATDIDFIWGNCQTNPKWFIMIEEKVKCGDMRMGQYLTLKFIDRIFRNSNDKEYEYRGFYFIQFENTGPENSEWIRILKDFQDNEEKYTEQDLMYLYQNGSLPEPEYDY